MAGTTYIVSIDLQTKGNLPEQVSKVNVNAKNTEHTVSKLSSGFDKAAAGAGQLFDKFDAVVTKVADVAVGLAKWGALGAAGALAYGVVHLNNELEQTKIALGAIFEANGVAADLPTGMRLAQDAIAKMRVDAQKLPGEFSDLRNIFTSVAIPGFQAGASIDQLREMSGKMMAFAKVAQIPMDQAAREGAMLLSGRSGAHNVLGLKLAGLSGDAAQAFNKESAEKRFADVGKYLDKYKDSIDEFGKSWDGISSTTVDIGKQWLTIATQPIFDRAKEGLAWINEWFNTHRTDATKFAEHLGWELGHAYDIGLEKIQEWWPAIKAFAANAYDELKSIWEDVKPYVDRFGEAVQSALKDPGTIDKLLLIAKLWAVGKGLSLGAGLAGGALPILKFMGAGWGLGGAAGAAAGGAGLMKTAGSAVGAIGNGIGTFLEAKNILGWGEALAGAAEAATVALLPMAPAVAAAAGVFAIWEGFNFLEQWKQEATAMHTLSTYQYELGNAEYARIATLSEMDAAEQNVIDRLYDFSSALATERMRSDQKANELADNVTNPYFLAWAKQGVGGGDAAAERQKGRSPSHPGGGGGTHIAKIEITVSGNDEPNRVAALVVDKLNKMGRHRTTSPHVPGFGSG